MNRAHNRIDLTGRIFGRLTVIKFDENSKPKHCRWWCLCTCGKLHNASRGSLATGYTKSCGCFRKEKLSSIYRSNLVGKTFGRLNVLKYIGNNGTPGSKWLCQCVCGKQKILSSSNLLGGSLLSCGCLHRELVSKRTSKRNFGENNYFWKGGITPENIRIRNSIEYRLWREAVFARDNWTCQKCGKRGNVHAHHIKSFSEFPELHTAIANGETLCVKCHGKTSNYGCKSLQLHIKEKNNGN